MLDTSVRVVNNAPQLLEVDYRQYTALAEDDCSMMSSATHAKHGVVSGYRKGDSPLSGNELSQDLYALIESFNVETPIENFDNDNSEAFQCVIDDVIDAAPSGEEFDFLDNICGFTSCDIPVKNNSSSVTGAACVYTCAAEKDRCGNQMTCARTASSTCINNGCDALSQADQELLEKLPVFLENIDSVSTKSNGCVKRDRDSDMSEEGPRKRSRTDNSSDKKHISQDTNCSRGS